MRSMRYLSLGLILASASIRTQLEYRMNFIVNLVGSLLSAGGALVGLVILLGEGESLGGWSYHEALVVVGLFTLVQGFIGMFLQPNLNQLSESIRTGTLDFTLIKPIDTQFLVSVRYVNIFRLADVIVGLALIGWAMTRLDTLTLPGVVLGMVLVGVALIIVYSIWFLLSTTAFWFVKVEHITEFFESCFQAGRFPVTVFPSTLRWLFTLIIPVAFITTVPAATLAGRIETGNILAAFALSATLAAISRLVWRLALKSYTSASS